MIDAQVRVRQPSKKTGQGRHAAEARGRELYPTPPQATEALLRAETLPHTLWEPAAGLGHMAAVLSTWGYAVVATDLYDYGPDIRVPGSPHIYAGVDFLTVDTPSRSVGAVITNPPFSLAAQFVRQGLRHAPRVYILARLAFLEGRSRQDILDTNLRRVLVFVNRLPMMHRWVPGPDGKYIEWTGKKSTSAMSFAWFVFERGARDTPVLLSRISWR